MVEIFFSVKIFFWSTFFFGQHFFFSIFFFGQHFLLVNKLISQPIYFMFYTNSIIFCMKAGWKGKQILIKFNLFNICVFLRMKKVIILLVCIQVAWSEVFQIEDKEKQQESEKLAHTVNFDEVRHHLVKSRQKRFFLGPIAPISSQLVRIQVFPMPILPKNFILFNIKLRK